MNNSYYSNFQANRIESFRAKKHDGTEESRFEKKNFAKELGYKNVTSYNSAVNGTRRMTLETFVTFCVKFNEDASDYIKLKQPLVKKQTPQKTAN